MYAVFFGSDRKKVRDTATLYIEKELPQKGQVTTIVAAEYELGQLTNALGATSLFGGEECFILDTPSDNKDFYDEVITSVKEMGESSNNFIILEESLLAPTKKTYAKFTNKMEECVLEATKHFNTFSLAEALAQKDRKKLWVLLQEAKLNGMREEEIIGMLWWQLKALRLAKLTNSAVEAGMKEFPYDKAKRALVKFSEGEVESLSQSLLQVYHRGHAGLSELDLALEEWTLTI